MVDCFKIQKKERDIKPKSSTLVTPLVTNKIECQAFKSSFFYYMEDYKPFMSDGYVSIDNNNIP